MICPGFKPAQNCMKEEIQNLKELAEGGFVYAQFHLASIHYDGSGIQQNSNQAFHWFMKAAEQNHALSQYQLALMYYRGERLERDWEETVIWLEEASEQGHVPAQHRLARIYYKSKGDLRNLNRAFYWCKKAAEQGYVPSRTMLHFIERDLRLQRGGENLIRSRDFGMRKVSDMIELLALMKKKGTEISRRFTDI